MKKLFTLILALLLVVGLSVPAMAFTGDTEEDDDSVPYDLKIYLVEYDDNDFYGIASLPKSDRGYAKNEIVAAVVELYVPEDEVVAPPDNLTLVFGGDNVDLDVKDNYNGAVLELNDNYTAGPDVQISTPSWNVPFDDNEIIYFINRLAGEDTFKWLFFAKVTDDDASLYAKLKDGLVPDMEFPDEGPGGITITLDGVIYSISKIPVGPDGDMQYIITVTSDDYVGSQIVIDIDEDHVSKGMTIVSPDNGNEPGALGVDTDGELGVMRASNPAVLLTDGNFYDNVMDIYNDVVVDVFGMDYMLIGNYVRDSFFEDLVSPKTLTATVDIEPWVAYVTVPDNIVVDPPKTGDAASIMGFVMVALAGAGVVALRRRG